MSQPAFSALQRLAQKVLEGDVVFFIGAGFSLDSEGNSGTRQIKRLLIRLTAFIRVLDNTAKKETVGKTILTNFQQSFDLKGTTLDPQVPPALFPFLKSD